MTSRTLYRHRIVQINPTFYIARIMDRVTNNDVNNRTRRSNTRRRSNQHRKRNIVVVNRDQEANKWEARSSTVKDISVPIQSVYGRRQMAHDSKRIRFMDTSIYPPVSTFLVRLPALYYTSNLLFGSKGLLCKT